MTRNTGLEWFSLRVVTNNQNVEGTSNKKKKQKKPLKTCTKLIIFSLNKIAKKSVLFMVRNGQSVILFKTTHLIYISFESLGYEVTYLFNN